MAAITDAGPDWSLAACTDLDVNVFYPVREEGRRAADLRTPKAVCNGCQIKDDCLAWALFTREPHGVWGGLDEKERANLLRRQTRKSQAKAIA